MADKGKKPRKKTILELVDAAKSCTLDSAAAMSELVERYEKKICVLARTTAKLRVREELEELRCRGIAGLVLAANRFDKNMKNFSAFATTYIKGLMLGRLPREAGLDIGTPDDGDDSVDLLDIVPDGEFLIPESSAMRQAEINELWRLTARLPRNQRVVLYLRYKKDLNMRETAERMGISKQAVVQVETHAINNMRLLANKIAA